jgi:hypothetical protein
MSKSKNWTTVQAVRGAVDLDLWGAVNNAVYRAVDRAVDDSVWWAVDGAVFWAVWGSSNADSPHPALQDFLEEVL